MGQGTASYAGQYGMIKVDQGAAKARDKLLSVYAPYSNALEVSRIRDGELQVRTTSPPPGAKYLWRNMILLLFTCQIDPAVPLDIDS